MVSDSRKDGNFSPNELEEEDIPIDESEDDDSSDNQAVKGGFQMIGHVAEGKDLVRSPTASSQVKKPPLVQNQIQSITAMKSGQNLQHKPKQYRVNSACPKNQKRMPNANELRFQTNLLAVEESGSFKFVK